MSKEYLALHPELGLTTWPENKSKPSAPKLLRSTCEAGVENIYSNSFVLVLFRLGFHQCLKFSDGTGGCNGCLNNHGMGLENRHTCVDEVM